MTVQFIQPPFTVWPDVDGEPLEDGYIYIGQAGLNPETNPITVYFNSGLSIPAAQPLRTIGGFISNSGSPTNVFASSLYVSITVRNKNSTLVYTNLNAPLSQILGTLGEVNNVTEFINSSFSSQVNVVNIRAFHPVLWPSVTGEKGRHRVHRTGATATLPSVGTPTTPSSIGTGIQSGYYYDALGQEWTFSLDQIINILMFGAYGGNIALDSPGLANAFSFAVYRGVAVHVPSGIYITEYNQMVSDFVGSAGRFCMYGDGDTSIIQMGDNQIEGDFRVMFAFDVAEPIEYIEMRNMVLDMNARGSTPPAGSFDYEHSHTVRITSVGDIQTVRFNGLIIKDPTADGLNVGSTGVIDMWVCENCQAIDRTRTRRDIQFSRLPDRVLIDNFVQIPTDPALGGIETENLTNLTYEKTANISNCNVENIDWNPAGNGNFAKLFLSNSQARYSGFFAECEIHINNCSLRLPSTGRWNNLPAGCRVSDTKILHPYDDTTGEIIEFYPFPPASDHEITFTDCDFMIDYEDPLPFPALNYLIQDASTYMDTSTYIRERTLTRCKFDPRAQRSIDCYRNGDWYLNDCVFASAAGSSAIRWLNSSARRIHVYINGGDCSNLLGSFIDSAWQTSGYDSILYLRGSFIGDAASLITTTSGNPNTADGVFSNRTISVSTSPPTFPISGLRGDVLIGPNPLVGQGKSYSCTVGGISTALYRMQTQNGVKFDTTANRPTTVAQDVGLQHLDTTLGANGVPIWFNGTNWVNSAGAVV